MASQNALPTLDVACYRGSVAALRAAVLALYTTRRDAYLLNKYGDADERAAMAAEERAYMLRALAERHPEWLTEDPFEPCATWRVRESSLPPFPPAEVADASRRSAHRRQADAGSAAQHAAAFAPAPGCVLSFFEEDFRELATEPRFREDALLFKFALLRRFDTVSASERFLHFRSLVFQYSLPLVLTDDARRGIALGAFCPHPDILRTASAAAAAAAGPTTCGANATASVGNAVAAPYMLVLPRRFDWGRVSVAQMQGAWFYTVMSLIAARFAAQTAGVVICNSLKGYTMSNFRLEFNRFVAAAATKAMPIRLRHVFIANQPTVVEWVVWPTMKQFLSAKIVARLQFLGKEYGPARAAFPANMLMREMGGEMEPVDPAQNLAGIEAATAPFLAASASASEAASEAAAAAAATPT